MPTAAALLRSSRCRAENRGNREEAVVSRQLGAVLRLRDLDGSSVRRERFHRQGIIEDDVAAVFAC